MFYNKTLNELIDLFNISIEHENRINYTKMVGIVLILLSYAILIPTLSADSLMLIFFIISGICFLYYFIFFILDFFEYIGKANNNNHVEYRHMNKLRYYNDKKYLYVLSDNHRYYEYHTKGNAVSEKDIATIIKSYFSGNEYGIDISTIPNEKNIKYKPNEE